MNLRDFKIGTRLSMGFGSILLILAAMVLLTNVLNYRNKAELRTGLETATAKNLQASAMKSAMLETGIAMRNIGLQSDVSLMQKEEGKVKEQRKRYDSARDKLQNLGLNDAEKKVLADIAALDKDVDAAFKEAIGQVLAFNSEGAAKVIASRIDPLNQRALTLLNKLVDMQNTEVVENKKESAEADSKVMMLTLGLSVLGVARFG